MKSSRLVSAAERVAGPARLVFAGIVASGLALWGGAASADQNFSDVRVDLSALSGGGGPNLKSALEDRLRYYFADELRGGRGAPVLVVRITGVTLNTSPPTGGYGEGSSNTDYLEGEALVVGRGGQVFERYPMLAAYNGDQGGWYLPGFTERKTKALANHYAYWLRRRLPDR